MPGIQTNLNQHLKEYFKQKYIKDHQEFKHTQAKRRTKELKKQHKYVSNHNIIKEPENVINEVFYNNYLYDCLFDEIAAIEGNYNIKIIGA